MRNSGIVWGEVIGQNVNRKYKAASINVAASNLKLENLTVLSKVMLLQQVFNVFIVAYYLDGIAEREN